MFINKATLDKNAFPLTITNNSDNNVCIPEDIKISICEQISNDNYR